MWSRRANEGMGQVGLGVAFWFLATDSTVLRIFAFALAARGVSQLVIAYLNHPDRIAREQAKRALPPG